MKAFTDFAPMIEEAVKNRDDLSNCRFNKKMNLKTYYNIVNKLPLKPSA